MTTLIQPFFKISPFASLSRNDNIVISSHFLLSFRATVGSREIYIEQKKLTRKGTQKSTTRPWYTDTML